ncbi:hypothetical protein [Clostridium merdae]|uniref:hypothetical protein n=1 Tax=Clostridium merdae TaxID=1958780 RepID=UPI000A272046|nr:hypothetical protein [Clostridium merdae]
MYCQPAGLLNLYCFTERLPLSEACIYLADACGNYVSSGKTNSRGLVQLHFRNDGLYRIWAGECSPFQPMAQGCGVCLNTDCSNRLSFPFRTMQEGSLLVTLRDKNYPEYTLSKGVFTLWRIY